MESLLRQNIPNSTKFYSRTRNFEYNFGVCVIFFLLVYVVCIVYMLLTVFYFKYSIVLCVVVVSCWLMYIYLHWVWELWFDFVKFSSWDLLMLLLFLVMYGWSCEYVWYVMLNGVVVAALFQFDFESEWNLMSWFHSSNSSTYRFGSSDLLAIYSNSKSLNCFFWVILFISFNYYFSFSSFGNSAIHSIILFFWVTSFRKDFRFSVNSLLGGKNRRKIIIFWIFASGKNVIFRFERRTNRKKMIFFHLNVGKTQKNLIFRF